MNEQTIRRQTTEPINGFTGGGSLGVYLLDKTPLCDDINLKGAIKRSYYSLLKDGDLRHVTWKGLLLITKQEHEAFLDTRDATLRESRGA